MWRPNVGWGTYSRFIGSRQALGASAVRSSVGVISGASGVREGSEAACIGMPPGTMSSRSTGAPPQRVPSGHTPVLSDNNVERSAESSLRDFMVQAVRSLLPTSSGGNAMNILQR